MGVLKLIPYQCCIFYGICSLASALAWGSMRGIDPFVFIFFGLALPLSCCLFNLFEQAVQFSFLIMPFTLGGLYLYRRRQEQYEATQLTAMQNDELQRAEEMIEADPLNATAYWMKGKVYDAQERFDDALEAFRRSHELCRKTMTDAEIEDLSEWLRRATDRQAQTKASPGKKRTLENGLLGLAVICCWIDWRRGIDAVSLLLFARWLHSADRVWH